jgi:pyridoxal phosphate enzyme (YggS family)
MEMISGEIIKNNLAAIREKIARHLERSGRQGEEVTIMAVTKGFPQSAAELARDAGLTLFGENRVQEAEEKFGALAFSGELHLIGHLQSNKAKKAAALFACVQSIDKYETALELNRQSAALGKKMPILLEVNTSGEASKSGYPDRAALLAGLDTILLLESLTIKGLMTVGPLTADEKAIRDSFVLLHKLFEEITTRYKIPSFTILSMGMSQDFTIAVEEGATLVRIGEALFGKRQAA